LEQQIETINFRGVHIDIVERPEIIWLGCVDYASNNEDESQISETLKRYQDLVHVPKEDRINPDWSGALSINYCLPEQPRGLMFAQEVEHSQQDERYQLLTQPAGLWMKLQHSAEAEEKLFSRPVNGLYEYFGQLKEAAAANNYVQNFEIPMEIEYHDHTGSGAGFAYIPIRLNTKNSHD
jgi:hypothetical protein